MTNGSIAENITGVRRRLETAALRAGRDPAAVTLLAVTKNVEPERIAQACAAGVSDLGENYVQEALLKQSDERILKHNVRWHFIGHMQSNKVRAVVDRFAVIQSVDSVHLARKIGERAMLSARSAEILLQVKLDPTDAKFGVEPADTLRASESVRELPGIRLLGLMGMAPFSADPEESRVHFRKLRLLFDRLPTDSREILSMGMTGDFEVAVEEGSTMVRIGTAIFGRRVTP